MSVEQVRAALECRAEIPQPARHVLLVLAWYADPDGARSWPSVATISRHTGLSRASVQRALRYLESGGFIRCDHRSTGSLASVYHLHLPTPPQPEAPHSDARLTQRQRGPHTERDPPHTERKGPQPEAQSVLISPESQKDAGARAHEARPDAPPAGSENGTVNGITTPGAPPLPTPSEARARIEAEYQQRRARRLAQGASQSGPSPAPAEGGVISADRPR